MVGIIDFRKVGGQKIPDIVKYVKDYVQNHSNIEVVVTTDSQVREGRTIFCTAVIMYDMGDGEHGHGAHCIWRKWDTPEFSVKSKDEHFMEEQEKERLRREVRESCEVATELQNNGVTVDLVEMDINPVPGEKEKNHSNRIFEEMKAYVAWAGFDCSWKNDGNCFASFPDKIVKK